MLIQRWTITDHAEWLRRRRANINGSEVAALFGQNPYLTPFALYADKAGLAELASPDSDVLRRGRILEPAVAAGVREERPDWTIEKAGEYIWSPVWQLGCTPDFYAECPQRGAGVVQAKSVAKPIFDEDWAAGPPEWIILQTLQEMMLANTSWGAIAALVMSAYTVDIRLWEFERHAPAEKRIIAAARNFWSDVAAGRQPKADWGRDDEIIKAIYPRDDGSMIDLSSDRRMPELLEAYEQYCAMGKHAEDGLRAVKAEIAARLGPAAAATVTGWEVTNKTQKRAGYSVGETEFRVLRVKRIGNEELAA
jgi:predicted phage-related endonuclease